jgi:hypothetical protein
VDGNQAGQLLVVIPSLRKLEYQLPIKIIYPDDDNLGEEMRKKLDQFDGVVTRDSRLMTHNDRWRLAG